MKLMGSILSAMTIKMSLHLSNQIWLIRDVIRDPAPYYQHTVTTMTPDLLAGSELGGMPGQSGVNSIKGAGSGLADRRTRPSIPDPGYGYDFKKAAAGTGLPLRPRTDELQRKFYEKFLELKRQGVNVPHFMGVSKQSFLH